MRHRHVALGAVLLVVGFLVAIFSTLYGANCPYCMSFTVLKWGSYASLAAGLFLLITGFVANR